MDKSCKLGDKKSHLPPPNFTCANKNSELKSELNPRLGWNAFVAVSPTKFFGLPDSIT